MQRRPGGVRFAGWLMGISGAFSAIGGLIVLLVGSNTREMARRDEFNQTLCGAGAPPCEDPG